MDNKKKRFHVYVLARVVHEGRSYYTTDKTSCFPQPIDILQINELSIHTLTVQFTI